MIRTIEITKRQAAFIKAEETEVLFGGAAGGGKSFGQLIDALTFALRYPRSKQLMLRRTYPELDRSLIRESLSLFPREIYSFSQTAHTGKFKNGSIIDFGYCDAESDIYRYQSSEYDVIRFDELTHFTERQYIYLISRVRGANPFPKQIKSTTNPGGVGHSWVKRRFVDPAPAGERFSLGEGMTRIFLPAKLSDNGFLKRSDPDYEKRLLALPESEKRALLYGDWDIFEGQYFDEFRQDIHVIEPFEIPRSFRRYRTIDYGLDRTACLWIATSQAGEAYVYREFCESGLSIGEASKKILELSPKDEEIYATLAPPDLFGRSQESGKSKAVIFAENGLHFTKTANDRECGWLSVKELLSAAILGRGGLYFFSSVREVIRCLPALMRDRLRPTDCATEPHDITHAPDALRGFAIYYTRPKEESSPSKKSLWSADMWEDYNTADERGKQYLIKKYGDPN